MFMIVPLTPRASLRVFDYYERGDINDRHYLHEAVSRTA
jgi:hypothetical protein